MTATKTKIHWQCSDHGAGKFSVQVFDSETGKLIDDRNIVKDVDGWRVVGQKYDRPQHATPRAAAEHYATIIWMEHA